MLPSSPSSLSLPLPLGTHTHSHSPYRRSISAHSQCPSHHHIRVPSLSRNLTRPTPCSYASFDANDFAADNGANSTTAAIAPATFSSLPPADRRLLKRHTMLLWALSAGFLVSVIVLTVSIVLAATEAKAPGRGVKWFVIVTGILGFVGAMVCTAFGWDACRGRKARAERQESWVELQEESDERTRRERRRQQNVILDIRSRQQQQQQQIPSPARARPQSRGRLRNRDEEMGPENHPLKTTLIHTTHPPSPPKPPHPRHPYTRQNSLSQPNPPNLNRNLNLNLDLTPFRGPSCDRLLAHERQKQRLAQKAAQGMIFLYAHGAASAHHNAASLTTRPSPPSPGNATSPPASAPTDPWKIDIVPPRPGPRMQYSAFRAPPASSSSANTADPFANPVPADSHAPAPAPPRRDPASTPARCDDHLLALLALSASPGADDACSDTASVRERLRKQSVERVQRWRARNEEMMGGGTKDGESGGRAVRRVKGVVGLRGVLRRFGSS